MMAPRTTPAIWPDERENVAAVGAGVSVGVVVGEGVESDRERVIIVAIVAVSVAVIEVSGMEVADDADERGREDPVAVLPDRVEGFTESVFELPGGREVDDPPGDDRVGLRIVLVMDADGRKTVVVTTTVVTALGATVVVEKTVLVSVDVTIFRAKTVAMLVTVLMSVISCRFSALPVVRKATVPVGFETGSLVGTKLGGSQFRRMAGVLDG